MIFSCLHDEVTERPKYAPDDLPGHYLCTICGSTFPLIGDTDEWKAVLVEIPNDLWHRLAAGLSSANWVFNNLHNRNSDAFLGFAVAAHSDVVVALDAYKEVFPHKPQTSAVLQALNAEKS